MKTTPTPIRLSDAMRGRVNVAAAALDIEKQEAMRCALSLGLEILDRLDHDLDGAVVSHLISTGAWKRPDAKKSQRAEARHRTIERNEREGAA